MHNYVKVMVPRFVAVHKSGGRGRTRKRIKWVLRYYAEYRHLTGDKSTWPQQLAAQPRVLKAARL